MAVVSAEPEMRANKTGFSPSSNERAAREELRTTPGCSPTRSARDSYSRMMRSEEHTSELQSRGHLVCRLLLEKKKKKNKNTNKHKNNTKKNKCSMKQN